MRDWECESILEEKRWWMMIDMDWGVCWSPFWVEELKSERALSAAKTTHMTLKNSYRKGKAWPRVTRVWVCFNFHAKTRKEIERIRVLSSTFTPVLHRTKCLGEFKTSQSQDGRSSETVAASHLISHTTQAPVEAELLRSNP
ncbi:unnamed protein product [Ilex paraguariensis]|uniref:Uncharacterized protein n=1 Tax=Ilex paraguariensis TaxID=185542 RepID=A0ABC8V4I0_9AQUA